MLQSNDNPRIEGHLAMLDTARELIRAGIRKSRKGLDPLFHALTLVESYRHCENLWEPDEKVRATDYYAVNKKARSRANLTILSAIGDYAAISWSKGGTTLFHLIWAMRVAAERLESVERIPTVVLLQTATKELDNGTQSSEGDAVAELSRAIALFNIPGVVAASIRVLRAKSLLKDFGKVIEAATAPVRLAPDAINLFVRNADENDEQADFLHSYLSSSMVAVNTLEAGATAKRHPVGESDQTPFHFLALDYLARGCCGSRYFFGNDLSSDVFETMYGNLPGFEDLLKRVVAVGDNAAESDDRVGLETGRFSTTMGG